MTEISDAISDKDLELLLRYFNEYVAGFMKFIKREGKGTIYSEIRTKKTPEPESTDRHTPSYDWGED